jgi:hypothetical protein
VENIVSIVHIPKYLAVKGENIIKQNPKHNPNRSHIKYIYLCLYSWARKGEKFPHV